MPLLFLSKMRLGKEEEERRPPKTTTTPMTVSKGEKEVTFGF